MKTLENSLIISKQDLKEDFELINYLIWDTRNLFRFCSQKNIVSPYKKILITELNNCQNQVHTAQKTLQHSINQKIHDNLIFQKHKLFGEIRRLRYLTASFIQQHEWQAPAFYTTHIPQAGRHEGQITLYKTDYKRDRHLDACYYEDLFCKEYYPQNNIGAFLTNSGMAAVTTVYAYLAKIRNNNKIVMGKRCYHENKELAVSFFGQQNLVWIDEEKIDVFTSFIHKFQPTILLLDSLTNNHQILQPEIGMAINTLEKFSKKSTIVIDSTCSAIFGDFVSLRLKNVTVIQIESLAKYHQFGLDKVTGGIIVGNKEKIHWISSMREHLGTNISDVSPLVLPSPNKVLLKKRLKRMERNANYFSKWLSNHLLTHDHCLSNVSYPRETIVTKSTNNFLGSFVVVSFKRSWQSLAAYQKFHTCLFATAKAAKVNLVSGTSFGFAISRMYLVASHTNYAKPFVRISFGTETQRELDTFINVFEKSIHKTALK